jgi:hypothetical protein
MALLQIRREAAINNKLHSYVEYVRKQRDAEIAIFKKQHEAKQDKLQKTLDQVLQKTKVSCTAKRQKTGLSKFNPLPDESRSKYDYIRRQSSNLKQFMDANRHNGSTGEFTLEVLAYFLDHHLGLASRLFMKLGLPAEIERQVVRAHEDWFDSEKACAIRNQTGMTWAGYRHIASTFFCSRNSEPGK